MYKISKLLPKLIRKRLRPIIMPLFFWLLKRRMIRLYSNFIYPGDLVFDVGAHVGRITEQFLKLGARVICIEPNPFAVKILKKKFGNNKNVTIIEKGLGEKIGESVFYICREMPQISTFSRKWKMGKFSWADWGEEITVPITTIDSLIEKFGTPKFCKIDVEGFELQVLKGLSSKIRFLSFEFTKEFLKDAKLCSEHISFLGKISFNFSIYNHFKLVSEKWLDSEQFFAKLNFMPDKNLDGDIFVKLD